MPALLLAVERDPDDADGEADERDDETDVAEQRADVVELRPVGLDDLQVEDAHPERLSVPLPGPEVHEVEKADEEVEAAGAHRLAGEEDVVQDAGEDPDDDPIDDVRDGADPEAGFRLRHDCACCHAIPSIRGIARSLAKDV